MSGIRVKFDISCRFLPFACNTRSPSEHLPSDSYEQNDNSSYPPYNQLEIIFSGFFDTALSTLREAAMILEPQKDMCDGKT